MPNEEVIDVRPEEGVNVNVENGVDMSTPETPVVTPKSGNGRISINWFSSRLWYLCRS